jgi:ATP-dependent helicase HrpB
MAERLPIYEVRERILAGARRQRRLIVSAPTGSGKSTQVPQMLADSGLLGERQVVILQPRRLAARLLAARVAGERGSALGGEVGYQIRFERVASAATRIRFVTEGVLLRQMIQEPSLPGIGAILFDEFHERHLYGDVTLARALDLQAGPRPDLLILVMSATLEAAPLEDYLKPCVTVEAEGRMFPVEIQYAATPAYVDRRPVWEQAAGAFREFAGANGEGDVLVFMPGSFEIAQTMEAIRRCPEARGFVLLPLHGELPPREQDAAVARYDRRKVVVATNVAETSLTIEGVRCVIDSGLARLPRYDPYRGLNTLLIEKISRASADQRAGRAGRTAPGVCFRLWSREEHGPRPAQELPEVRRLDLAEVVLALKAAGVENLREFRWFERPEERALAQAEELLRDLGALAEEPAGGKAALRLTALGRKMMAFPLHPRYARMLLAAQDYGCVRQACQIAALTQGRDMLLRNPDAETARERENLVREKSESDFWVLRRAWEFAARNDFRPEACRRVGLHVAAARQAGPLFQQFLEIARREGLDTAERDAREEALQKCILIGFSDRVARRLDADTARCELARGRRGTLDKQSAVRTSRLLVAAEVRELEGKGKEVSTVLNLATAIEEEWLRELFPEDLSAAARVYYDGNARRVFAEEQTQFRGLAIGARQVEPPPADAAARLLAGEVQAGRLALGDWDEEVEQWILRLNLLSQWCPELELPPVTEEARRDLVEQICHGAVGYKELKDKAVKPVVKSWLNQNQQKLLDRHAPERLTLGSGRPCKVIYASNASPHVAVRIQQLYGAKESPRIALGRIPVLVHILAPNMRAVQITQDLAGFWREHYPHIKQELQRKYPKHEWR